MAKVFNLAHVYCNPNEVADGIGIYSFLFDSFINDRCDEINVKAYTGVANSCSKIKLIVSLQMTKTFIRLIKNMHLEAIDAVLIEYPFPERNPIMLFAFTKLSNLCKAKGTSLFLSVHEYSRSLKTRRTVIDFMAKKSDYILSTDKILEKKYVKKYSNRDIPSIIEISYNYSDKNPNSFIFFGQINKSKAFAQLINAWKNFNGNQHSVLYVCTSSKIDEPEEWKNYNIKVCKGLSDNGLAKVIEQAQFCILPIIPCIGTYNSTFKTALLGGCITIGHFDDFYAENQYIINTDSNDEKSLLTGLNQAELLSFDVRKQMSDLCAAEGNAYSFESVCSKTINTIIQLTAQTQGENV